MTTPARIFTGMLALCCFSAGFLLAADNKKPESKPAEIADWSKYVTHSEVKAKIVKVERGGGLLIEVPAQPVLKTTGSGANKRTMPVPGKPEKFSVIFAEGALVRWSKLPKTDENGKKVAHTPEQLQAFKMPLGVPGYAAERTDLKIGQVVELVMVRPKEIAAAKATHTDLLVKRATIVGEDTSKPAEPPKKK